MKPIKTTDLLTAIEGKARDKAAVPERIANISIDTRKLKPNDVYWALSGANHDGHDFVEEAIEKQASACIVSQAYKSEDSQTSRKLIAVDDTLEAFQRFAAWYRRQFETTTIGITGSYAKTTARELAHSVLSGRHDCLQSQGNQNNEIGVPLTIMGLEDHHEYLIAELGAAKPGDIEPLTQITTPKIGMITGIGPAHLSGFQTESQIIETKGDLIAALPSDGLALIPGGEEWSEQFIRRAACRVVTFGLERRNDYHATHLEASNQQLRIRTRNKQYTLAATGRHHVTTALAIVALATELGYAPDEIQQGFDRFQPVAGRGRVVQSEPWTIIDETYNASPTASKAACRTLANWQAKGRRFLVMGDMLELGPESQRFHKELGWLAGELNIDFVYAVGTFANDVAEGVRLANTLTRAFTFDNQRELIHDLENLLSEGDVALVKGSRGMRMERVVESLFEVAHSHEAFVSTH